MHDPHRFIQRFIDAPSSNRYVLGQGDYARSLAAALPVGGYVDDFTSDTKLEGLPVYRSSALPANALVVVASMLRPHTALRRLRAIGVECLDYFAFVEHSGLPIRPVTFWPEFRQDYAENRSRYDAVRGRLGDAESLALFDDLIRFRMTADVSATERCTYDLVNQYFEDFLHLAPTGESFVDIGCFDGSTSIEFARRAPDFRHITAFEPSVSNHQLVERRLGPLGRERVTVHNFGLSDRPETLRFAGDEGSASRLDNSGTSTIEVRPLDGIELAGATFMKFDIEGAEEKALYGALQTIERWRPRLAISVYHRATDFWRIPEIVSESGVPYDLRLRHYTEGIDETVMFFLPLKTAGDRA